MKKINVQIFGSDGSLDMTMNVTMKKPIEGETFAQRRAKVAAVLDRDELSRTNDYAASWVWAGNKEGFIRKIPGVE